MYYAELNVPKNHVYLFKPHFVGSLMNVLKPSHAHS